MPTDHTVPQSTEPISVGQLARPSRMEGLVLDGRYCLIEPLGEGGMGSVWRAEQLTPVRREVAVKLIRLGRASPAALARFEAERQALAMMDHAGIATIFDGGVAAGDPYCVMELVRGEPLTHYCEARQLDLEARLRLLIAVCQAVQHAHQKGVIHRDLKPANILVSAAAGQAQPKVIDFGIAKTVGIRLHEGTLRTEAGDVVGTLEYMAPEQARGQLDVDTRADVYALGVLLHELLTGRVPFSRQEPECQPPWELLRHIREVEPARPSQRGAAPGLKIAGNRLLELDWIVMKCLEKDRARRYATAAALAEDLERFLRFEPVHAGPPSQLYRAKKFLYRHWRGVTAACVLLAVLLAGVIGTGSALLRAWAAERSKDDALTKERQAVASARQAEQAARKAEAESRQVLDFFTQQLMYAAQPVGYPSGLGRDVTLIAALNAAAEKIPQLFAGQPEIEVQLRLAMGTSYTALGNLPSAQRHLEAAVALADRELGQDHDCTLFAQERLAAYWIEGRDVAKGMDLMRAALAARLKSRPATDHVVLVDKTCLGAALLQQGNLREAHKEIQEALAGCAADPLRNAEVRFNLRCLLAAWHARAGEHEEALRRTRELLKEARAAPGANPLYIRELAQMLAVRLHNQERFEEADPLYQEAEALMVRDLGEKHPMRILVGCNRAALFLDMGRWEESRTQLEKVLPLVRAVFPPDHVYRGVALVALSHQQLHDGQLSEAFRSASESATILKAGLGGQHPFFANAIGLRGAALARQKDYPAAEPLLIEAANLMLGKPDAPRQRQRWIVEQLVELYKAWGKPKEEAKWQAELGKLAHRR